MPVPLGGKYPRQVDRDQHHLLIEVLRLELVPDLPEDALGFVVLLEAEGDPPLDPVQAELCTPLSRDAQRMADGR